MWGDAFAKPGGIQEDVYTQLALWRFLLGFGVGGEYPLAATIASEGSKDVALPITVGPKNGGEPGPRGRI